MRKRSLIMFSLLTLGGAPIGGQTSGVPANASAAAILDAGLTALGGEAVRAASAIRFVERARSTPHDQSSSPDAPYAAQLVEDTVIVDPYGEHLYRHERNPTNEQIFLIDGKEAFVMNPRTQLASRLVPGQPIEARNCE